MYCSCEPEITFSLREMLVMSWLFLETLVMSWLLRDTLLMSWLLLPDVVSVCAEGAGGVMNWITCELPLFDEVDVEAVLAFEFAPAVGAM
jgi:hypothetical protein